MTLLATCSSRAAGPIPRRLDLRLWSDNYAFRVTSDPMPPRALEPIMYRIVVQDKKTGQPIETGEGRIFATSADGANTNDGLEEGKGARHLLGAAILRDDRRLGGGDPVPPRKGSAHAARARRLDSGSRPASEPGT